MGINLKQLVGTLAPTVASALGGPFAGTAIKALSNAILGKTDGTEDEILKTLATADPPTLLKLKELEENFKEEMGKLGIELEQVESADRASARQRQIATHDWTPTVLGSLIIAGYIFVQWFILGHPLPPGSNDVVIRGLGIMDGAVMAVIFYYFGSSRGSAEKDKIIGNIAQSD